MSKIKIDLRIFSEIGYLQGVIQGVSMRNDISEEIKNTLTKIYKESKKRTDREEK